MTLNSNESLRNDKKLKKLLLPKRTLLHRRNRSSANNPEKFSPGHNNHQLPSNLPFLASPLPAVQMRENGGVEFH